MRLMRRIAREVLGEALGSRVWSRMEIIGDILVLKKPFEVSVEELRPLAVEILRRLPYIRSVWCAVSEVKGAYRTREYVHLAGELRSDTIYKEHGCMFRVDIRRVYVSQRLNAEHIRVARLVSPGEVVVNMFAGAGLFSIIIARHSRPSKVYSIDINPDAYQFMVENVKLNKVEDVVVPILGDAAKVIEERLCGISDRVLMPLPELIYDYLPYALMSLRGRGYLHVYDFVGARRGEDPLEKSRLKVEERLEELGARYKVEYSRVVRMVGPRRYQVVHDIFCERVGSPG